MAFDEKTASPEEFWEYDFRSDWGNTPGDLNHRTANSLFDLFGPYGTVANIQTPPPLATVLAAVNG